MQKYTSVNKDGTRSIKKERIASWWIKKNRENPWKAPKSARLLHELFEFYELQDIQVNEAAAQRGAPFWPQAGNRDQAGHLGADPRLHGQNAGKQINCLQ